jgi:hypothetical protein
MTEGAGGETKAGVVAMADAVAPVSLLASGSRGSLTLAPDRPAVLPAGPVEAAG